MFQPLFRHGGGSVMDDKPKGRPLWNRGIENILQNPDSKNLEVYMQTQFKKIKSGLHPTQSSAFDLTQNKYC